MPTVAIRQNKATNVTIVKKIKDYTNEPAFKKKAEGAIAFLKKHPLPKSVKSK